MKLLRAKNEFWGCCRDSIIAGAPANPDRGKLMRSSPLSRLG